MPTAFPGQYPFYQTLPMQPIQYALPFCGAQGLTPIIYGQSYDD